MERKEFRQRLKRLLAWALVMVLMVNSVQGGFVSVHAEGTEGETGTESTETMVSIPVKYYDVFYTDDGMENRVAIRDRETAGEGEAYFTSTGYTTEASAEAEATSILDIVLPTVEKDGYFFSYWGLGISGEYNRETQEVSLGDGWTAGGLASEELPFIAYFQEILRSKITYDYSGGTMDGVENMTSYEIIQPDIETYEYQEPVTTSVPVMEGKIFTDWSMETTDMNWYDSETGLIHGYFEDGAESILYANWRDENTITVEYLISPDYQGMGSINIDEPKVTYYESRTPTPVVVKTPEVTVTEEGWFFNGWYCPELADMPQTAFELFYPECEVSEDGMTLIGGQNYNYTMYAEFVPAMQMIVSFDAGNGEEPVQNTIFQSSLDQETVTITLPEVPVYEDCAFAGWYCENTNTVYPAGAEVTLDIDQKFAGFYAQWEVEVPITYDTVGGTITSTNHDMSVTIPIDAISAEGVVLPTVEKENAFFLNWELGISSGGIYDAGMQDLRWDVDTPASTLTGLPFTAVWQDALVSAITFEYTGGTMNGSADSYETLVVQPTMDSKSFEKEVIGFEPTKKGFIFTGWELQVTETGSGSYDITDTGAVVTGNYGENYTLVAQWRPENTITITTAFADGFADAGTIDGGTVGNYGESTESDGAGNLIVTLPVVKDVKEAYIFVGWKCYDANGAEVIVDGYVDIADFDGTIISGYREGTTLLIAYPTDEKNSGGNTATYVLEAQFVNAKTIEITYELNGGIGLENLTETAYQSSVEETAANLVLPETVPTREGYEFAGWTYSVDNKVYEAGSNIACAFTEQKVVFTAQWEEKEYVLTVEYILDGGNITSEEYTTEVNLWTNDTEAEVMLPEVEKEGYFFTGWSLKNNNDFTYESGAQYLTWSGTAPAYTLEKLELTANWIAVKKTIVTYDLNGGNVDGSTTSLTQEYTQPSVEEELFSGSVVEEVPARKGYIFTGWSLGVADGSSYEGGVVSGYYGTDYTMTAQWRSEHVLNFTFGMSEENSDYGEVEGATELTYNESETAGPIKVTLPEVNGLVETHLFVGWKCYDETGEEYKPAENGYDAESGYAAGTEFEFDYVPAPGSEEGNSVLYTWEAQFVEAKTIEVTYDLNGGMGLESLGDTVYQTTVEETTATIALPEILPTREGYEFAGWTYSVDNKVYEAGSRITCAFTEQSVTFTAQWEEKEYVLPVEYMLDGGTITSEEYTTEVNLWTNDTEAEVMLPEVEKEGYFFTGWSLKNNNDFTYESGAQYLTWSGTAPAYTLEKLELTANWIAVKKTIVTYDLNGGNVDGSTTSLTQEYTQPSVEEELFSGSVVEEVPARKGYIFTGWSLGVSDGSSYEGGVVSGYYGTDYTMTAQWRSEHVLNFTFGMSEENSDYGEVEGATELTFNESETAGPIKVTLPEVNGLVETHLFVGWKCYDETGEEYKPAENGYDAESGYAAGTEFEFDYVPAPDSEEGNSVLYTWEAQFVEAKTIEVTYDLNGGMGLESLGDTVYQTTVDETIATIALPEILPTREGYEFAGWTYSVDNKVYKAGSNIACAFTEQKVAFTAQWEEKEYVLTVEYILDGGNITSEEYTTEVNLWANDTEAEVMLPEVEKEGYFFTGWSLKNNNDFTYESGAQYLTWSGTAPAYTLEKLELTANWIAVKKTIVTYDLNGGNVDGSTTSLTQEYTQPSVEEELFSGSVVEEVPARKGYIFTGWSLGVADGSSYEGGVVSGYYGTDYTMTAQWRSEHVLNFTFGMSEENSDYGEVEGATELTYNESETAGPIKVTLPEVNGLVETHLFVGWKCYDETGEEYKPAENGYDAESGYAAGTEFEFDYVPAPDSEEGNSVLYTWEAQFVKAETIEVTYDLNGGMGLENLTETVYQSSVEETAANLVLPETVPTRDGYEFAGWLYSGDNSICKPGTTLGCAFTLESVKFTAQWNEKEYEISLTYDIDGGKIVSTDYTQNVTLLAMSNTAEVVELPVVEKDGYFFKYWKLSNNEEAEYQSGTQYLTWSEDEPAYLLKGLTLKAYWQEALKSIITFNLDGGAWSDTQEVPTQTFMQPDSNTAAFSERVIEATPKKSGFVFTGWTMDATDASGYNQETHMISGLYGTNYMLTALWEATIGSGTSTLQSGMQYRLEEGSWTVNGDTTVYAGGNYFYVSEDGDYTFTEK